MFRTSTFWAPIQHFYHKAATAFNKKKNKKKRKPKTQQVKFRDTHCESPPLSPHTPLYCFRRGDDLDFHDCQRRSSMLT